MGDKRRKFLCAIGAISAAGIAGAARAQARAFPSRAIQIILPVPAGGGVDANVRKLTDRIGSELGASIVAVNRPGAAGLLGANVLAAATPDGHTLGYMHSGHLVLQAIDGRPDVVRDFTPVTRISASMFAIVVPMESPYRHLEELLSAVAKRPDAFNYGAGGPGSPGHIAFEKLRARRPGLDPVQVPFKGAAESVLALARKDIDFVSGLLSSALPLTRGGKLRVLAVTGRTRSSQLPDVPTIAEAASVPGYEHISWGGLMAPAGTPAPVAERLDRAIRAAANDGSYREFVEKQGGTIVLSESPGQFAAYVREDLGATVALMTRLGLRKVV